MAVNHGDDSTAVGTFARTHHLSLPLAVGRQGDKENPIFQAYRVTVYPTTYLIDEHGTIVWRGAGFSAGLNQELSEALGKLGIK